MERQNYIPPTLLTLNHPPPPPHYVITDVTTTINHHHHHQQQQQQLHSLLTHNHILIDHHIPLLTQLTGARKDLRHVADAAGEVKAEREAAARGVYEKMVRMEVAVKLVKEWKDELIELVSEIERLRVENKELGEKVKKVSDDVDIVLEERNKVKVVELEVEMMKKEIQRGRELLEHEKRVHASNIKQRKSMEKHKTLMASEIKKLQVEVIDAGKRARAAAAAEVGSVPGTLLG